MPTIITRGSVSARAYGFGGGATVVKGSQSYTTAGTYTWVAPAGVTSVSIVAVGGGGFAGKNYKCGCIYNGRNGGAGGGLGYKNNLTVIPGNSYTVVVGAGGAAVTCTAAGNSYFCSISVVKGGAGGSTFASGTPTTATGGNYTGTGGGVGGDGGNRYFVTPGSGGGGAGGYSGAGGTGGRTTGAAGGTGAGGGGGGGGPGNYSFMVGCCTCYMNTGGGGGGGGVGLYGQGSNGAGGTNNHVYAIGGGGGSCGTAGANAQFYGTSPSGGIGGAYGGGAGGNYITCGAYAGVNGAVGAVRIVYPGLTRQFPSTCVGSP